MLLTYTDPGRVDVGALPDCTLDMAYGDGENDFVLRIPTASAPDGLSLGSLVYADGTCYGGIVDGMGSDTTGSVAKAVYEGRTFHGVLDGKVLRPDAGEDYLEVAGEANAVLLGLVWRMGLLDLFSVSAEDSGVSVSYRFARYATGYAGIRAMLASKGLKLHLQWDGGRVVLSALPARDLSEDEFDAESAPLDMMLRSRPVNHLVCLGKGEMAARTVIDLYADEDGRVSQEQTLFGADEVAEVYDYSSAEADELLSKGIERLTESQAASTCDVSSLPGADYDVGDTIGGRDSRIGVYVKATVSKVVVSVGRYGASASCEAGGATIRRVTLGRP